MSRAKEGLRFGGVGGIRAKGRTMPLMITPHFHTFLSNYWAWRLARETELPPVEPDLFDPYSYASALREDWGSFPLDGMSLREMYVFNWMTFGAPPSLMISSRFGDEPLGPGVEAQQFSPCELVERVGSRLSRLPEGGKSILPQAAGFDGVNAHAITLTGVREDGAIQFLDPMPGPSPFSTQARSMANAFPDPAIPGAWCMSSESFARVVVAVTWPHQAAEENFRSRVTKELVDHEIAKALVSNHPESHLLVVASAMRFAELLEQRDNTAEAMHWWRLAAVVGGGYNQTKHISARLNPHSLEAEYWSRIGVLAKEGRSPWTMPDAERMEMRVEDLPDPKQAPLTTMDAELSQALDFLQGEHFVEAKALLTAIREDATPLEQTTASFYLGWAAMREGRFAAAVEPLLEVATSANVSYLGSACEELGNAYWMCGQIGLALAAYERGLFCGDAQVRPYCAFNVAEIFLRWYPRAAVPYFEIAAKSDSPLEEKAKDRLARIRD